MQRAGHSGRARGLAQQGAQARKCAGDCSRPSMLLRCVAVEGVIVSFALCLEQGVGERRA